MELIERAAAMDALDRCRRDARAGSGRIVFVGGESGVGKTALVGAFLDGAGPSDAVARGSCDPFSTPEPLAPFRDMPELEDLIRRSPPRHDLLTAMLDLVRRPTTLVIEDIQWADEATLDALRYLGRRIDQGTGVVIVTYREPLASGGAARRLLGDLATAPGRRDVRLEGLSLDGVRALTEGSTLNAERIHELTAGNPFFAMEVLASPEGALPTTVADAVAARAATLDSATRRLLDVVSLAPGGLEAEIALAVADVDGCTVDAAADAGLISQTNGRLRYRHELARQAIEQSVSIVAGPRWHEAILAALEAWPGADPARLAHHAEGAGNGPAMVRYGTQAAAAARARGSNREAADHLRRVLGSGILEDPATEAQVLSDLAAAIRPFGDQDESVRLREAAVEMWRRAGDRVAEARATTALGRAIRGAGDATRAGALVGAALERLIELGDDLGLAEAHAASAYLGVAEYRIPDARAAADRAIVIGRSLGPTTALIEGLNARSEVDIVGMEDLTGVGFGEEAAAIATAAGELELACVSLLNLGGNLLVLRQYEPAVAWTERGIELGRSVDLDVLVHFGEAMLARGDFERGRYRAAIAGARRALGANDVGAIVRTTALHALGASLIRLGEPGGRSALEEAWRIGERADLEFQWPIVASLAEAWWLAGRGVETVPMLMPIHERLSGTGVRWANGAIANWIWRFGGDPGPLVRLADPYALRIAGRWRAAAEAWEALGCPYEQADALAAGDEEALADALAIFTRLGATPAADRVRATMREAGVRNIPPRPRASTRAAPAQLTRRQVEVLGLLGLGLTNAEIADRLFITEKTAEHHVSAVLLKLAVRSRAEAAVAGQKLGIDPIER